jgi:general secretion pathway protein D
MNIGDRVPVATGSFQAGVGVGSAAGAGFVNPLVNTQFQYIDVGVNVEVTPRVHPNRDVSLKLQIEVSSVSSFQPIGGIQQPVISQRKIAHEIRLTPREGMRKFHLMPRNPGCLRSFALNRALCL